MLILAATPIGNLGDASPRLAQVLANASLIVAEDTRMIHKLMKALDITTSATVLAANEHSEASVADRVLDVAAESDVVGSAMQECPPLVIPDMSCPLAHELEEFRLR